MLTILKKWLADPVENVLLQAPRALAASVLCAFVDCSIYFFLILRFGFHPLAAAVAGYLVGSVLQYLLCSLWVFARVPARPLVGFAIFCVLSAVGLGITCLAMTIFMDLFQLHYGAARILALAASFGWNFFSRRALLLRLGLPQS